MDDSKAEKFELMITGSIIGQDSGHCIQDDEEMVEFAEYILARAEKRNKPKVNKETFNKFFGSE